MGLRVNKDRPSEDDARDVAPIRPVGSGTTGEEPSDADPCAAAIRAAMLNQTNESFKKSFNTCMII
jgi:hypothetical protein